MTKLILLIAAQIILLAIASSTVEGGVFARTMDQRHLGLHKKEVLTHLRFYWQDSLSGPNPSAVRIHQAISNSSFFGLTTIMDDPLTTEVSRNSTVIGHAQGTYTIASQGDISYMMVMNIAFSTGKYNGSTITILGRNRVFDQVREMPVVGGSGMFRFARGYVELRTKFSDFKTGLATVEYNCYVLHY